MTTGPIVHNLLLKDMVAGPGMIALITVSPRPGQELIKYVTGQFLNGWRAGLYRVLRQMACVISLINQPDYLFYSALWLRQI